LNPAFYTWRESIAESADIDEKLKEGYVDNGSKAGNSNYKHETEDVDITSHG
jgi:hypothetical protein